MPRKASLELWVSSILTIAAFSPSAIGQPPLMAPPATTQTGGTFSTVIVNPGGNLSGNLLTVTPAGGQTGVIATATLPSTAIAVLTDTLINIGSSGGVTGLDANGSGATLTLQGTGSEITQFNGGGDTAVLAENGGTIHLLSTDETLVGGGGNHPVVARLGGIITMNGVIIDLSGGGGNGLEASSAGQISATNSQITILGFGGNFAAQATDPGTNISLDNTTLTVGQASGGGNFGVQVLNGAHLEATNGTSISSIGSGGDIGLVVQGAGSTATLSDTSITAGGPSGGNIGVSLLSGGVVAGTGGTIQASGTGGDIGVRIDGFGSEITLTGTAIQAGGPGSSSGNIGVLAQNSGLANLTDTTILTTGNGDMAIELNTFGQISMLHGSVETQGPNGQAIFVTGSGSNQATFDGTSVTSDHGTGILAQGSANSTLDFWNGASLTAGNGLLLLDQASGIVSLNATNDVQFVGNIDATGASGTANVTLRQNSSLRGAINQNHLTGAIDIAPAEPITGLPTQNVNLLIDPSTWTMTASSTLNQLEVFPGTSINFASPTGGAFKTLVVSSLTGNGGIFGMNVDLPSFHGDLLVIQTGTPGFNEHHLQITNLNQGQDPAPNHALLVVQSAQASGLEFPSNQVDAGTFKYESQRGDGSAATPDPHNWYLVRDTETPPAPSPTPAPTPTPSPTPGPIPTPTPIPPHPSPTPIPPGPTPTPLPPIPPKPSPTPPGGEGQIDDPKPITPIQALTNTANAAIGTYSGTMPMFYADLGTLNQRMGELRLNSQRAYNPPPPSINEGKASLGSGKALVPSPPPPPGALGLDFWIRGFGSGSRLNNQASRAFEQNLGGFQIGADRRFLTRYGDLYLGGFLGYFHAARDFFDGGNGHTDAFSVGAYTTLIHPSGFYADLVLKQTYLWNEFSTPTTGEVNPTATANYSLPTLGASLEAGKRWDFGKLFIEPQAQLAGAWADSANYQVSNGLRVNGDSQTSLRGRLGLRGGLHIDYGDMAFEPFATVSVDNEFLGGDTVRTDQTGFNPTLSGPNVQAGAGLNAALSRSISIYIEYDYINGNRVREPWAINGGFRWQW